MENHGREFQTVVRDFLVECASADDVEVRRLERLGGGAIQENYALDVLIRGGPRSGEHALVLRTDSLAGLSLSLSRAEEFAVLKAAFELGVAVPEVLWLHRDAGELGKDFYIMRRLSGSAAPRPLVREYSDTARERLLEQLGSEIAKLHKLRPPGVGLEFLPLPECSPALYRVQQYRACLDRIDRPQPTLEWALRWLECNVPPSDGVVLTHGDFRTGNYMVDHETLSGILDWEFAGWSEAMEDIGWMCARCWRFGAWENEAGGLGNVASLARGYERAGGTLRLEQLPYWRIMATVRWAVIALMQAERHLSGEQPSLELALTGRMLPEMELDMIQEITAVERGEVAYA